MVLKGVSTMSDNKWGKKLLGLLAVGAAVGGTIAYFYNKNNEDDFEDDFEDEDFDLDDDLKDPSDRGYVSLGTDTKEAAKNVAEAAMEVAEDLVEEAKEAAEDFVEEAAEAVEDLADEAKDLAEEVKENIAE